MANEFKVKNGLIVNSTQKLVSPDLSQAITLRMLDSGTLSFLGTSGQLFSITDSLTGTIFAVNDISGVPSIEVFDTGKIQLAETFGNVLIGSNSDDGSNKLQVIGNTKVTGNINVTGSIKGPVGPTGLFGQIYFGAVDHQWGGLQISDSHGEMLRLRSNQNPLGPLIRDTFWYSWMSNDVGISRDAANTLAQRNSTNPQTFRVYNTFTDASNYERAKIGWNSNTLEIGTEAAGTGTLRNINLIGGNVGIGTSTPSYKFDIRDNVNGNLFINIANTNSGGGGSGYGSGIRFMGAVSNIGPKASGRIYSDFSANAYQYSRIVFQTANGDDSFENALVVQGGKVAIGASTADYKLDVAGSLATGSIGVENILKLYRPLNSGPSYPQIASFAIGRYSTDAAPYAQTRLDILLNELTGSELLTVMTLQANGNIGIGTTSPSAKLDVVGDIEINSSVRLNSETTTLTTITQTQIAAFAKATYSSGKFIIQTKDTVTNEVQISELLVVHDETTASATEYGIVYTGLAKLATYNVDISGDNVRILATSSSTNSTTYKISETLITA